jgi:ABC-2 type transport system ATP-binding protein
MSTSSHAEILEYLNHGDADLAVRRLLDYCLDTGQDELISEAIRLSQAFHQATEIGSVPAGFTEQARQLVEKAAATGQTNPAPQPLITADQVRKTYTGGSFSLKPISFSLKTGQVLGVVGENGNGKTTLLRCLAGQLALDGGKVDYHLLRKPDYYSIKNHIAFIPQRIPKWYGLLKDNLHFSASISGIHGSENDRMVEFMLERLNLSKFAHLTWNQISSGYRTRFEIARILLQRPRLLILDEPLANLDINAQQTILTDLVFMARAAHNPMGIVLSSQQLHEVEKVADTVIFIKDGNCLYSSTDKEEKITSTAIEFETTMDRDTILGFFEKGSVSLQYNGGFYTIESTGLSAAQILTILVNAPVPLTYYRDITYSTKRFF